MSKILVFDKGGRQERIKLVNKNQAPKDFFQSIDFLRSHNFDIENLSSSVSYQKNLIFFFGRFVEQFFSKLTNVGLRPLSVFQYRKKINLSDYVVSLTDGFSLSLGFYYAFFDKKNKIKLAGAFHKLSDFDDRVPIILKRIYFHIFQKILRRLDFIIFYGEADRDNSVKFFKLMRNKTFIIKFGVDTSFWQINKINNFSSKYLFSIGQDPARDFQTLLKVKTNKKIHIHTILLDPFENKKFKVTSGKYQNHKDSFSDLKIRELYQNSFAVLVPLKDVFQPSGYSVTLQAMACGKPVILTRTKGLWAPTIFKSLTNCILVNPENPEEIENAIKILENNEEIYNLISSQARKTVEENFSLKDANNSTLEIFNKFQ